MDLLDIFVGFPLLLVGLLEVIAIVWVYGKSLHFITVMSDFIEVQLKIKIKMIL